MAKTARPSLPDAVEDSTAVALAIRKEVRFRVRNGPCVARSPFTVFRLLAE